MVKLNKKYKTMKELHQELETRVKKLEVINERLAKIRKWGID